MAIDLTRFDFHVVRFMNSYDVERMGCDEVGQYILLLCKAWMLGKEATLPDDMKYLTQQARCKKLSPLVLSKFPIISTPDGPMRRNEVLYGEWLLARDRSMSASERGRKGNELRYSENNSDTIAIATESPSEKNFLAQSKPTQSFQSNQATQHNSVEFSGGSFGQGDFKFISTRWWSRFKKQLNKSKQNKEQYAAACSTFSEDVVLKYFDIWAENNSWVTAHPKGGNRLYVFLKELPVLVEGDQMTQEREESAKTVQNVNTDLELQMAARIAQEQELEKAEKAARAENEKIRKEFEVEHANEI